MPDNVTISNAKLAKVSTNESRQARSDAYQLIFDLFQEIVKAIATDKDFVTDDLAAEIAALRTAAESAGATLPAPAATEITTKASSGEATTTDDEATTTVAATTTAASGSAANTPAATTPAATTSTVESPTVESPTATTPAGQATTSSGATIKPSADPEKSTPSQSPQISSGSFLTLAVSLLIGNLVSRFML